MVRKRTLNNAKDAVEDLVHQELFAAKASLLDADAKMTSTVEAEVKGALVPYLTPLTRLANTFWEVWQDGELIDGFSKGAEELSLHESGMIELSGDMEVMGNVIKGGTIPIDQVVLPAGQDIAQLEAQLLGGMRAKGFHIVGRPGAK